MCPAGKEKECRQSVTAFNSVTGNPCRGIDFGRAARVGSGLYFTAYLYLRNLRLVSHFRAQQFR